VVFATGDSTVSGDVQQAIFWLGSPARSSKRKAAGAPAAQVLRGGNANCQVCGPL